MKNKQMPYLRISVAGLGIAVFLLAGCASQPAADTAETAPVSPGKPTNMTPPPSLPTKNTGPKTPEEIQAFAKAHGYNNVTIKK